MASARDDGDGHPLDAVDEPTLQVVRLARDAQRRHPFADRVEHHRQFPSGQVGAEAEVRAAGPETDLRRVRLAGDVERVGVLEDPLVAVGGLVEHDDLVARFEGLSTRLGFTVLPPEVMVNLLGYRILHEGRLEEAVEVFEYNTALYPESANVYDSLGEAYLLKGNTGLAIENYEKALELNPDSENARVMLEHLRSTKALAS